MGRRHRIKQYQCPKTKTSRFVIKYDKNGNIKKDWKTYKLNSNTSRILTQPKGSKESIRKSEQIIIDLQTAETSWECSWTFDELI